MPHNEQDLTEREYYLIGRLAEPVSRGRRGKKGLDHFTDEAKRLVQQGYLERAPTGVPVGNSRYIVTPKGRAVWQAYRFTGP